MRTEGDAELLYGVYQCVIGLLDVQLRGLNGRAVFHTVARVMPYGKGHHMQIYSSVVQKGLR